MNDAGPPTDWTALNHRRLRTATWAGNVVGRPLTDRRIAYYQNRGWYSPEAREARKKRQAAESAKRSNFTESPEGRLIYCPW